MDEVQEATEEWSLAMAIHYETANLQCRPIYFHFVHFPRAGTLLFTTLFEGGENNIFKKLPACYMPVIC
jgi:hypothetical protein